MNNRPILWRAVFAVFVIVVFALSIYPLHQRDFYETFKGLASFSNDKDKELVYNIIKTAREKQAADKNLFSSVAFEQAMAEKGVDLTKFVKTKGITDNYDVISLVRKNASSSIRLGLDLNGGAEFFLEIEPDEETAEKLKNKQADLKEFKKEFERFRDISIEILRNRLEEEKIYEAEITPAGENFISLKVPIVSRDEKVKLQNLIKRSAKLQFKLVHPNNTELIRQYNENPGKFNIPLGYQKMESQVLSKDGSKSEKHIYFVYKKSEMTGKNIKDAFATTDEFGQKKIILNFNDAGAKEFGDVTNRNVKRELAIILDGKLYSAPVINGAIWGGNAEITGRFSKEEAQGIANALKSGSLPVKINVAAVFDTDPTLGRESVRNGLYAGVIATFLIMLFMGVYYLRLGLVADVALLINIVLMLGFFAAFEATLTLPGIAGIILSIGMAVDANVLIYERIREELAKDKGIYHAIELGYDRAFTTIFDSNLTTLFIAVILMWFGSGSIKGFGVALTIGIITSMFTALFLTRLILDVTAKYMPIKSIKMLQLFKKPNFDVLRVRYITGAASIIVIAVSLAFMGVKGGNIFGIDFTGGIQVTFSYDKYVPQAEIAKVLDNNKFPGAKVTYKTSTVSLGDNKKLEILIRDSELADNKNQESSPKDRISAILEKNFPESHFRGGQEISIGGLIGWEFSKSAIFSLVLSLIGIILYVSVRFEFSYAIAGIVALVHDVIISTGIFLFCGGEISLNVIAALLTIIGYSINDTIVVFDRIREDAKLEKNMSYKQIINLSINQTLSRTVLTAFTTLIAVLILYVMGGVAVKDFVFVMLVGLIVGTYSSIFIASPIVAVWHRKIGAGIKDPVPQKGQVKQESV
ncbi:MAG: hypothetical protein A2020_12865 [Lentisphaerae bacterium GWF2_45_14]|nr:MAG: hypothetical protein A2020_12865 [Lentisphaerae bacterium GWF2_45_14]